MVSTGRLPMTATSQCCATPKECATWPTSSPHHTVSSTSLTSVPKGSAGEPSTRQGGDRRCRHPPRASVRRVRPRRPGTHRIQAPHPRAASRHRRRRLPRRPRWLGSGRQELDAPRRPAHRRLRPRRPATPNPRPHRASRKTVTRRIRDAIARTERAHPPLGRHLQASIRTGVFCSYAPEHDVRWTVEAHR